MKHLSTDERLWLVEAAAHPPHPHLDACEVCRRDVEALRAALGAARELPVAEPSPLFWDHFSARVAERTRGAEIEPPARWWGGWRVLVPAAAVAGVFAAALAVHVVHPPPTAVSRHVLPATAGASEQAAPEGNDEAWEAVTSLADDVGFDAMSDSGLAPSPGAVDGAVWRLSDQERVELGRLLRVELGRAPSGS
jgi:hypothetical protein